MRMSNVTLQPSRMQAFETSLSNNLKDDPISEIEVLRREIDALQRVEQGRGVPTTPQNPPPPPPKKDFAIQEQTSSAPDYSLRMKLFSWFVGLVLLGGLAASGIALMNFMKTNDIKFIPDNTPGDTLITLSELAMHNTAQDCWVALHGDVYDLTNYARRHPGGPSWVTQVCAMDGTSEYARFHSKSLLRSVAGNMVGPLNSTEEGVNNLTANGSSNGGGSINNTVNNGTSNTPGETTTDDCANDSNCISMDELARHNTAKDCWVGLHANVYDLTDYVGRHP
jgi:cytochrome b involved in lipid metabolism